MKFLSEYRDADLAKKYLDEIKAKVTQLSYQDPRILTEQLAPGHQKIAQRDPEQQWPRHVECALLFECERGLPLRRDAHRHH